MRYTFYTPFAYIVYSATLTCDVKNKNNIKTKVLHEGDSYILHVVIVVAADDIVDEVLIRILSKTKTKKKNKKERKTTTTTKNKN